MLTRPMCCPNPIHDDEPGFNVGMDIIPDPDSEDKWFCCDCRKTFTFKDGEGKLVREPYDRKPSSERR